MIVLLKNKHEYKHNESYEENKAQKEQKTPKWGKKDLILIPNGS